MKTIIVSVFVVASLAVAGSASGFSKTGCASCHSVDKDGEGPKGGPSFKVIAAKYGDQNSGKNVQGGL